MKISIDLQDIVLNFKKQVVDRYVLCNVIYVNNPLKFLCLYVYVRVHAHVGTCSKLIKVYQGEGGVKHQVGVSGR